MRDRPGSGIGSSARGAVVALGLVFIVALLVGAADAVTGRPAGAGAPEAAIDLVVGPGLDAAEASTVTGRAYHVARRGAELEIREGGKTGRILEARPLAGVARLVLLGTDGDDTAVID